METVFVVSATGKVGVAAVRGALQSGRHVLAAVRNQDSARKMFQHVGTKEGITTVESDVTSETAVQDVVERVKSGKLPAFQHVVGAVGGLYALTPLLDVRTEELRKYMLINFETNFLSGSSGDNGVRALPSMTQGAIFSMANVASRDNYATNVRFNELYIDTLGAFDRDVVDRGIMNLSELATAFATLMNSSDIRRSRVEVHGQEDLTDLKHVLKVKVD